MKVSVIIPVRDRAKNTKHLLDILVGQKKAYPQTEIIAVENASKEDMSFLEDYKDIVLVHSEKGISNARNKGLDTATGDYIAFIDNDDDIPCYYLSVIYKYMPMNYDWYIWQWWSDDTFVEMKDLDINNPLKEQWALWGYLWKASMFDGVRFALDDYYGDGRVLDIITPETRGFFIQTPMYRYWFNGNDDSVCHRKNRGEDISDL